MVYGSMDVKNLITAPWAFPRASSLGFHLVTVAILSNFKIQLKYNVALPLEVGVSLISESSSYIKALVLSSVGVFA